MAFVESRDRPWYAEESRGGDLWKAKGKDATKLMESHATSLAVVGCHDEPWSVLKFHGKPWKSIESYGHHTCRGSAMESHGKP